MWNYKHFLRFTFGCTHHTCLGQVKDCYFYQEEEVLKINSLTSLCIISILFSTHLPRCWQGEVLYQSRASLVGDHFLYSHNLNVWFRGDIVGRNLMLVIFGGQRIKTRKHIIFSTVCSSSGYRFVSTLCSIVRQISSGWHKCDGQRIWWHRTKSQVSDV